MGIKSRRASSCTRPSARSVTASAWRRLGGAFYDPRNFPHDEKPRFINSVTNGKRAMPAWGALVKPAEIELLWAYVASYKLQ